MFISVMIESHKLACFKCLIGCIVGEVNVKLKVSRSTAVVTRFLVQVLRIVILEPYSGIPIF